MSTGDAGAVGNDGTPGEQEVEPLRVTQAARQLGVTTNEMVRLITYRRIRFVMRRGIAHVPPDAIEDYRHHTEA